MNRLAQDNFFRGSSSGVAKVHKTRQGRNGMQPGKVTIEKSLGIRETASGHGRLWERAAYRAIVAGLLRRIASGLKALRDGAGKTSHFLAR